MRRWSFLAAVAVVLGSPHGARAEGAETVYVGGSCLPEGVDPAAMLQVLRAELSPTPVAPVEELSVAPRLDPVVLALDGCETSPPSVHVTLWQGRQRRERAVDLSDVPLEDRSRTLGLALAETRTNLATSRPIEAAPAPWASPPAAAADAPGTAMPAATPAAPPVPTIHVDGTNQSVIRDVPHVYARVAFRYAPRDDTTAFGAGGGLAWSRLGTGVTVFGATAQTGLGDVTLVVPAATGFADIIRWSMFRLRVSLELGAAVAVGAPSGNADGFTELGFHAGANMGFFGAFPVGAGPVLELGGLVGYASSLRAGSDGTAVIGLNGLLLTGEASLRFE